MASGDQAQALRQSGAAASAVTERLMDLLYCIRPLQENLAHCIGALRGIADGLESERIAPSSVESLRNTADRAYAALIASASTDDSNPKQQQGAE